MKVVGKLRRSYCGGEVCDGCSCCCCSRCCCACCANCCCSCWICVFCIRSRYSPESLGPLLCIQLAAGLAPVTAVAEAAWLGTGSAAGASGSTAKPDP